MAAVEAINMSHLNMAKTLPAPLVTLKGAMERLTMQVNHMMCVTRKHTLRSLSLSYQKKDGRAWPFFWYDTDFLEFDSADIIDYILEKSVSCQKSTILLT